MLTDASTTRRPHAGRAFTLLELLVVVGVIGILLAIVLATGNAVLRTSQAASTTRLLGAIGQGLEQFKADHGYYPPLLNENYDNGAWGTPGSPGAERLVVANEPGDTQTAYNPYYAGPILLGEELQEDPGDPRSFNVYSLAIYLQGVGDLNGDGVETYDDPNTSAEVEHNLDDGVDGPGLRAPGADRSWGGARDRTDYRSGGPHRPATGGRVFGPYVAAASGRNLERIPDDDTVSDEERRYAGLYRFVDRWGNPIRYYRDWSLRENDARSMANVPFEIRDPKEAKDFLDGAYGQDFDAAMERIDPGIAGAPYVLLSVGQDGRSGHRRVVELRSLFGSSSGEDAKALFEDLSDNVRYIP